jgi:hypothetical protein
MFASDSHSIRTFSLFIGSTPSDNVAFRGAHRCGAKVGWLHGQVMQFSAMAVDSRTIQQQRIIRTVDDNEPLPCLT